MTKKASPGHKNKTTQRQAQPAPAQRSVASVAQPLSLLVDSVQLAVADPRRAAPSDILAVQRLAGNRAAVRLLQSLAHAGSQRDAAPGTAREPDERPAEHVARMVASSMSLAQPRGSAPSNQIQRAWARAIINVPVYQADEQHPNQVATGHFGRKTKSGTTIPRYQRFEIADQGAGNDRQYFQVTSDPVRGGYVKQGGYQEEPADLDPIGENVIVTQKTKLREIEKSGGKGSLKATRPMNPGVVLESTDDSRFVVLENRPWYTEMRFEGPGEILNHQVVDKEKAELLTKGKYRDRDLKLGAKSLPEQRKQVRVTEDTHLRAIVGGRRHSIEVGDKVGDEIKKDEIVTVDTSIWGVDEGFSMAWIAARTKGGLEGYIRKEKVTPEAVKELTFRAGTRAKTKGWFGREKTVKLGKETIEGNEIPQDNEYVSTADINVGQGTKVGDRFTPTQDAVATEDTYWQLRNRRTGKMWNIPREKVLLAFPALTKDPPQPGTTVVLTDLGGVHEPKVTPEDRASNVGVSIKRKQGENLQAGDKVKVDFEAGGVDRKGDTGWAYAQTLDGGRKGYVRTSKVRESAAELLEAAARGRGVPVPDRFVPAYVTSKTQLRDEKGQKTGEKKEIADQVMVNFTRHPPPQIPGPVRGRQAPQQIENPYYKADDRKRWVLVQGQGPGSKYLREYKVTVSSTGFERKGPEQEKATRKGKAYEAVKMLLGGAKETAYEVAGGWGVGTTGDIATHAQEGLGWDWWPDAPTVGYEWQSLATAGALGSLLGLVGCAEGLRDLFKGGSVRQRLKGLLQVTQSGLGATTAFTQAVIHGKGEGDEWTGDTADQWKAAAGWSAGIANAITSVKALFLTIHSWFRDRKKKGMDRFLEGVHHLLEAGASGVKSAKFITETFQVSGASQLAMSVPFLGLAVDLASIILGFRKWWVSSTAQREAAAMQAKGGDVAEAAWRARDTGEESARRAFIERIKFEENALLQNVTRRFLSAQIDTTRPKKGDQDKLFVREKRGIRSLSTAYTKTKYYRVHPKIMFAIRNKDKLDQRRPGEDGRPGELVRRSPDFLSSDYYVVVVNGTPLYTVAVIGVKHVKITDAAERAIKEYEFASKVEEVSKKKKTLGLEQIESGFVNLVGDALSIAGPAAVAGAITKGVIAAIDAGFNFARFLGRQWQTHQGKKRAVALKYQGQVTGIDKSRMQKQQEYYEHAYFIMEEIATLKSPEEIVQAAQQGGVEEIRQRYQAVRKYIEMTGVNTGYFYAQNGKPVKQVKLIVESLAER